MIEQIEAIKDKKSILIEADCLSFMPPSAEFASKIPKIIQKKTLNLWLKPLAQTIIDPSTTPQEFDAIIEMELVELIEKENYKAIFVNACPESQMKSYYKVIEKYDLTSIVWMNNGTKEIKISAP